LTTTALTKMGRHIATAMISLERDIDRYGAVLARLDGELAAMPAHKKGSKWEADHLAARKQLSASIDRMKAELDAMGDEPETEEFPTYTVLPTAPPLTPKWSNISPEAARKVMFGLAIMLTIGLAGGVA
jgi:hypothetical protein